MTSEQSTECGLEYFASMQALQKWADAQIDKGDRSQINLSMEALKVLSKLDKSKILTVSQTDLSILLEKILAIMPELNEMAVYQFNCQIFDETRSFVDFIVKESRDIKDRCEGFDAFLMLTGAKMLALIKENSTISEPADGFSYYLDGVENLFQHLIWICSDFPTKRENCLYRQIIAKKANFPLKSLSKQQNKKDKFKAWIQDTTKNGKKADLYYLTEGIPILLKLQSMQVDIFGQDQLQLLIDYSCITMKSFDEDHFEKFKHQIRQLGKKYYEIIRLHNGSHYQFMQVFKRYYAEASQKVIIYIQRVLKSSDFPKTSLRNYIFNVEQAYDALVQSLYYVKCLPHIKKRIQEKQENRNRTPSKKKKKGANSNRSKSLYNDRDVRKRK